MPSIQEILRMLFEPRRLDTRQPVLQPGAQRIELAGTEPVMHGRPAAGIPPFRQDLPVTETRRDPPILSERVISTTIAPPVLAALGDFFTALNDPRLAAQQSGGRVLQAQQQLETGRRLAIDQSQLELSAAEIGDVADARAEQRRLQRADFGLRTRRQQLDEKRFQLESDKFDAATQAAAKKMRLDLGNPSELATASVLAQLGVDTDDEAAVRRALADPRTLASIGRAARRLKPDASPKELRTLSERLASRFFDANREPQKYSELVLEIERELRSSRGSDTAGDLAALRAEQTNLRTERTSVMSQVRSLETNLPFLPTKDEKAKAQAKLTALHKQIAQLNTRLNQGISEMRALEEQGDRRLQLAPTDTPAPEEGGRRLSISPQLSVPERERLRGLIGAFGGPLPETQGRTLQRATPEATAGQVPAGQVKVRAPNGEIGFIPAEDLPAALGAGYQVVQ